MMSSFASHLTTRIGLAIMALVAATALLWLNVLDDHRHDDLLMRRNAELHDSMRLHASRNAQTIETLRQDVLFLASTPPISGIVRATGNRGFDPRDNNDIEVWHQRLREIFSGFLTAHPSYFQVRFIGVADAGRELVRVQRNGDQIVVVAADALQPKGSSDYFTRTSVLSTGQVYLSAFDLNREQGLVEQSLIRTLRAATPVFDTAGKLFGIVIINMDVGKLINFMRSEPHRDVQAYMIDRHGHFLLHPDRQREFSWETGNDANLAQEFPELAALLDPGSMTEQPLTLLDGPAGRLHVAARRVPIDPGDASRFLLLLQALPDSAIEASLASERNNSRTGVLLLTLLTGFVVWFGLRVLLRPLHKLTVAANAIASGARDVHLPQVRQGEIADLSEAFRVMLAKVSERESDLEQRVRERTAELRLAASVFENTSEGVMVTDDKGVIVSVNPAFTEITGYSAAEAMGQRPSLLKSDHHDAVFYQRLWASVTDTGSWQGEIWNRRKGGEAFLEWLTINRIPEDDGTPAAFVAVFNDITELRRSDERIRHLAFHDALTGLPNRALIQDRLQHAIERSHREEIRLAVMFLDLDRFKGINDTLGHDVGDLLLQEVAARLKKGLRSMDTVARMGGDEFVVLLEDIETANHCADIAANLIESVQRPMQLQGNDIQIGTSVGIALCPEDGRDAMELMKHADTAMYAAKSAGRNTYRFFRSEMTEGAARRHQLEMELRHAIPNGELELHYQPKIKLGNGSYAGVEALVRWRHPRLGLVPPGDFIPVAEETGLIIELGDWVLERVCAQSAAWHGRDLQCGIALNVSAKQLQRGDLADRVIALTRRYDVRPACLQIELTESVLMADPDLAIGQLRYLRELGVTIAVDDFGTGYSSLAYLRRLPIDVLKIDRSFVMDADRDEEDAQVVRTIIALGRSLKLAVVAEGVETEAQANLLRDAGCDLAQGYLYARPLPAAELESWLAQQP